MEKLNYITKAYTVGVFLVVVGHCMPTSILPWTPKSLILLKHIIYSFHMPFFMFLSGWLFMYKNAEKEVSYAEFILNKAKRLLIPYIFLSTVAFFLKNMLSCFAERGISFTLKNYIQGLIYPENNAIVFFWFLPALLLIFFFAPCIKKVILENNIIISVIVGILLTGLNILRPMTTNCLSFNSVTTYLVYFYIGCIASYYREKIKIMGRLIFTIFSLALLIGVNCFIRSNAAPKQLLASLDFAAAITGIAFAFSFAYLITRKKLYFFNHIDGYYYQIFLLSWFFMVFFRVLFQMRLLSYPLTFVSMLIGGLLLPVPTTKFITKRIPALKPVIGL